MQMDKNRQVIDGFDERKNGGTIFSLTVLIIVLVSFVFSAIFLSVQSSGQNVQETEWYRYLSYSLNGVAILGALAFSNHLFKEGKFSRFCRIEKTERKYYLYAVLALIATFFGFGKINGFFIEFLQNNFGYKVDAVVLPDLSPLSYILVTLTVCILPAVAEELLFRGVIIRDFDECNIIVYGLIGGLLFSIFHMNPAQTPYQFTVGFTFTLLSIKSKSVLPTTLAHFLNNFIIINVEFFAPTILNFGGTWDIIVSVLGIICFVLFIFLILKGREKKEKQPLKIRCFLFSSAVGVSICLLMWFTNFFS